LTLAKQVALERLNGVPFEQAVAHDIASLVATEPH
jgi:hypothetical protein